MLASLLIANRGEIACRIIRTARAMGLRTIAVYSEADRYAQHVALADEAYPIGPAPVRESYLRTDRIIAAALAAGAEAIHPGYGFLSENAEFAEACAAAGLVFVGPPPPAIRAMGSKAAAKALMEQAGIPLVPGYHGASQENLAAEAARIGYPVLIKASAGGGGKGMRVVESPAGFAEGLALAQGEAASAFGDDRMLIERYLTCPRHIEIQVFADTQGQTVSLYERDCSIQRRHQKILEEAPAPGLTPEQRQAMGAAACNAARAIGYVGAGTVEFIAEENHFYFMEMNTRLQVEHPVTEMITGLDLVEWQLRIAAGEPLPLPQEKIPLRGHAIEARLYAEDPARDFAPSTGRLTHLRLPAEDAHTRIDSGVREGDAISVHYDPMLAKLIVWDEDRPRALVRLRRALAEYEAVGPATNLPLLRAIAAHPAYQTADLDTGFIPRHAATLLAPPSPAPFIALAAATYRALDREPGPPTEDNWSPWNLRTAWRLNGDGYQDLLLREGEHGHAVRAYPGADGSVRVMLGDTALLLRPGPDSTLEIDGVRRRVPVIRDGDTLTVVLAGQNYPLRLIDPLRPPLAEGLSEDRLRAPMPGRIVAVHAESGASVAKGQVLVVLEAMKVQMRLAAPRDGTIGRVAATPGDLVEEGAELVHFAP